MTFRRDLVQGRIEPVSGAIRDLAGEIADDPSLEETVSVNDNLGKVQSNFSEIREVIRKLPG